MKNKKNFLIGLISFSLFLFYGCQNNAIDEKDVNQNFLVSQEKRIGIIQSLGGAKTSSGATHILRLNNGTTIYLASDVLDLNSDKYFDKEVEVSGKITRTTDGKDIMKVDNIDVLESENIISQDIPVWISYVSDNFGISFKYRDDYLLTEDDRTITLSQKPENITLIPENDPLLPQSEFKDSLVSIHFRILSKDEDFDLAKAMGIIDLSSESLIDGGYVRSKITQKGVEAYKVSMDEGNSISYYLKTNFASYEITFISGNDPDTLQKEQNLFYDILFSLSFNYEIEEDLVMEEENADENLIIGDNSPENGSDLQSHSEEVLNKSVPVDNYETFSSDSLNFSVKYPKGFYFAASSNDNDASRTYEFSNMPLDEGVAGDIKLSILKQNNAHGTVEKINGKDVYVDKSVGDGHFYYYFENNNKMYRISVPESKSSIGEAMISSIEN